MRVIVLATAEIAIVRLKAALDRRVAPALKALMPFPDIKTRISGSAKWSAMVLKVRGRPPVWP